MASSILLALIVVLLAGLYLLGLGTALLLVRSRAEAFLLAFAGSAQAHYSELLIRLLVGVASIQAATALPWSSSFVAFGWILLLTSLPLLLLPWRWHQRFAQQAVPSALRLRALLVGGSMAAGALLSACAIIGLMRLAE